MKAPEDRIFEFSHILCDECGSSITARVYSDKAGGCLLRAWVVCDECLLGKRFSTSNFDGWEIEFRNFLDQNFNINIPDGNR